MPERNLPASAVVVGCYLTACERLNINDTIGMELTDDQPDRGLLKVFIAQLRQHHDLHSLCYSCLYPSSATPSRIDNFHRGIDKRPDFDQDVQT
ncbi:unnamed protein product [Didymodactylos carnosus]|uniref:Uncharacterized protein n=1 Tax=Didymodactylos carnosus TaxID=1234261 RepID=A0A815JZ36_9BILA|nr:unnamed protein product [Didymodactylos carnosus]CAF1385868.1 unnamed protein product [Didymodactylos carnosus]CAF3582793.1 unnamed protein product [Didymodactylos carnosus]CAF4280873.1 unnamed protein product [Didymodactylos carnosus]